MLLQGNWRTLHVVKDIQLDDDLVLAVPEANALQQQSGAFSVAVAQGSSLTGRSPRAMREGQIRGAKFG